MVDDDASFAQAIGRLLRAAGFGTTIFHSAEAFLQNSAAKPFACLVLDVQLGGMSGFDLGRRLGEMGAKTPFIFVTALEAERRQEAEQMGCLAYFHKPVSGRLLLETIHRAVDSDPALKTNKTNLSSKNQTN